MWRVWRDEEVGEWVPMMETKLKDLIGDISAERGNDWRERRSTLLEGLCLLSRLLHSL